MTASIFLILRILLSVCLYAFIILLFYFLWKDSLLHGKVISNKEIPTIKLETTSTNSFHDTSIFNCEEITLGRSPNCDLCLSNEIISNHHARIVFHHKQWWVEDLNSKNGTSLNGMPLELSTVLSTGDLLSIGNYQIQISIYNKNSISLPNEINLNEE